MDNVSNTLCGFDNFELDLERKMLRTDGEPIELTFKAVELLCMLIEHSGQVVRKEEILEKLWQDSFVEESVLSQNVYLIRKALEKYGSSRDLIETVPKRGYRFVGKVRFLADEEEVTIERHTVEKTFIGEAEFVDDNFGRNLSKVSFADWRVGFASKKARNLILLAGLMGVIIAGTAGVNWIYREKIRDQSPLILAASENRLKYERLSESGRAYSVGLSPDDLNAAYIIHTADDKYSLTLHHLPSNSKTEIVPPQDAHINNILFSPDGNYIYYAAQKGDNPLSIYRMPLYGGASEAIARNFVHQFSLSPDGEWLSFYRWEIGKKVYLEICRSRDGSERKVIATSTDLDSFKMWGVAPQWSPDGKRLLVTAIRKNELGAWKDSGLVEIEMPGGRRNPIVTPSWYKIGQAYWAADGRGLYLQVREKIGEPVQLWYLAYPSGDAQKLTNDTRDYRTFRPSSDGKFLVATTHRISSNLFLLSTRDFKEIEQLTFDTDFENGAYGLKWTNDGRSIIYAKTGIGSTGNLFRFDLDDKRSSQLTYEKDSMQNYVDVTPDGSSVVFGSNRAGNWNIWQMDLDGNNLRQTTSGENSVAPEISPDGKWLYYAGKGLWKMPVEGGKPTRVMEHTPGTTRISPVNPGKLISFYGDPIEKDKDRWKFVLYSEDQPRELQDLGIRAIVNFEWSIDGRGIYFADVGESFNNLWFLSLSDLKQTRLTKFGDQRISNMSLSPDGETFALSRGSSVGNVLKISGLN